MALQAVVVVVVEPLLYLVLQVAQAEQVAKVLQQVAAEQVVTATL
jgi:hypothetical protein